jgi:hypothetical protein
MSSVSGIEPDQIQQIKQSLIPDENRFMRKTEASRKIAQKQGPKYLHNKNPTFGMMDETFGEQHRF